MDSFSEGSVSFRAEGGEISRKMEVFYNPVMKENRDISVKVIDTFTRPINVGLPLAGSGVRGMRMLLEASADIVHVSFNDHSTDAVTTLRENLSMNGLLQDGRIEVFQDDAVSFLLGDRGFDYIDIDPFGSPVPFIESAVRRISRGGIIAVTATDTAALCGSSPRPGQRKYWARTLRCDMMHELGLRVLIRRLQLAGTPFGRALTPVIAYSRDHYMRVFLRAHKGKKRCDALFDAHGYVMLCPHCLHREAGHMVLRSCPRCGERCDHAGPLWLGSLAGEPERFTEETHPLITQLVAESSLDVAYVYDLAAVAKKYRTGDMPTQSRVIGRLQAAGYQAVVSHHGGQTVRTDAPIDTVAGSLRGP